MRSDIAILYSLNPSSILYLLSNPIPRYRLGHGNRYHRIAVETILKHTIHRQQVRELVHEQSVVRCGLGWVGIGIVVCTNTHMMGKKDLRNE